VNQAFEPFFHHAGFAAKQRQNQAQAGYLAVAISWTERNNRLLQKPYKACKTVP